MRKRTNNGKSKMDQDELAFQDQNITKSTDLLKLESVNQNQTLENICSIKEKRQSANESMKTFRVPQSSVLAQVKNFLPHIDAANKHLHNVPACTINMEDVDDADQVIEMNIALVEQTNDTDSESENESDSESDSSSESDCCIMGEITTENLKLAKNSGNVKGQLIEEINSTENSKLKKDNSIQILKDLESRNDHNCDNSKIT